MDFANEYTLQAARFAKLRQTLELVKQQLPPGCSVDLTFESGNRIKFEVKDTVSRRFLGVLTPDSLVDNRIPHKDLALIRDARSKIDYTDYSKPSSTLQPKLTAASFDSQNEMRLALKESLDKQRMSSDRQHFMRASLAPKPAPKKQLEEEQAAAAAKNNRQAKDYQEKENTPSPSPFRRVTPFA
jgi:hypothetical protein